MRIAFIGNFRPEHSTENDLLKSLRILGHEIFTFQEDEPPGVKGCAVDAALWCHTHDPAYDKVPWKQVIMPMLHGRNSRGPLIAFTLDLFRGLRRHDPDYIRKHPWFTCDRFVQPDDPEWLLEHTDGACKAEFSAPAILETSAYAAAPDPLHPAYGKIIFVGSETYHDEWPWRKELLAFLRSEYGDRFIHYDHSSGMRGHALNVLYASAAVVVGDSCFASKESRYTSDRLYESLGRGANLVYPEIQWEIDPMANLHKYKAGDVASLRAAIERASQEPIGWGYRYDIVEGIRNSHTYTHRLKAILEAVKG